jgi:hypothetical protein
MNVFSMSNTPVARYARIPLGFEKMGSFNSLTLKLLNS